jgi:hypothetical protein
MFKSMRIRITITESKGGGDSPETLIAERVIETQSHKQLTAKRAAQILAREYPDLEVLARAVVKTGRGWMVSKSTEPLHKCGYHYVWRHFYVASSEAVAQPNGNE